MYKIDRKHLNILGVSIISRPTQSVLRQVRQNVAENRKFLIVTPNPEHIIYAQKDRKFAKILNSADISIADGVGLAAAAKFLSLPSSNLKLFRFPTLILQGLSVGLMLLLNRKSLDSDIEIIKGRELFLEIVQIANKKGWKVVLVGDKLKSAEKALTKISANYKKIQLFAFTGPNLDDEAVCVTFEDQKIEQDVIEKINSINPHFLFVGFRAPVQEKWLNKWLPKLKVNGTMVLGGTFDYISGKSKLPPKFIENTGLEWLWRLLTGSQKFKRIITASVIFPYQVFLQKLRG
ncbi:hypothetical protein A2962_01190 [Candidatus Woesebacteria bacterium RIFCSPLOWO2_01_FULL_39_61]|uniref:Uncharacterized protein n=1 Tax=Candidatus Woesebacteria bacterium RIFCSPHIGHO2_02_FULL_39_13 TaxID=1802505 RepID=A0A1F7Z127_9BACT|nr:MAG: hypothetical protein A2692_00565 [Candidatus Woesebacteria bacterium RIFCSPHIGHO2_01_FULL_39_95]OGM33356.1 MAG: hypothetical protein A3D01_00510 [Candidatus Woesebacteria bacterium RIFCSPHIGHO2_02_FULL_39_13]OGM36291.1 MAG: hypothetical protein A3E13_03600 [Candidatus Woesebacteria bacterium RIFCSPHIGHO2_12_FULL_40_20]OGM66280.1 MAG: hypothetical protein A2962_01190 [Candidatus Woesebacteria bacterium RIFCSPLOWO2_01_FULL_39_61]